MTQSTFIIIATGVYVLTLIIIGVVLFVINKVNNNKYLKQINDLEREKNLIISAAILTELNKVEALINNEDLRKTYLSWQERLKTLKEVDIPKITDLINIVQEKFDEHSEDELKRSIIEAEMGVNIAKTKADFLLSEIKEITLSEERNREKITKLKASYRAILSEYNENKLDYEKISKPLELQFENIDKLFAAFEISMDKNAYSEVGKIVKAIDRIVSNLGNVINDSKIIIQYGEGLIPRIIMDIETISKKMEKDGFNLDYLNINYNIEQAAKKTLDIFQRLNVLDVEDSVFELKTMYDYFDSLYSDFDKEKVSRKLFEEYARSIIIKQSRLEKINNELLKKLGEFTYSYDLTEEEISSISEIKDDLNEVRLSYEKTIDSFRKKEKAYSKLSLDMEEVNGKLMIASNKLETTIKNFASLQDDEKRAHEQLEEVKKFLEETKEKSKSYKLPVIPDTFYVELSEAVDAKNELLKELEKKPISIKVLNTRVDNARDLSLKVKHTINECVKIAKKAETAIVYGNRYRSINKDVDFGLTKAENAFSKGNYKNSLDLAISAIDIVEPGIYNKLLKDEN